MENESNLDLDWDNYVSVFVMDPKYEGIRAPMWMDLLKESDQPFHDYDDDDAFFCKPDCTHPKTANSLINAPSFQSPTVKQTRTKLTDPITPFGDRTASSLNCKKPRAPVASSLNSLYDLRATENASNPHFKRRGALLSTSALSLNELKAKENASSNTKKISKYHANAENDNPNSPRDVSGAASIVRKPRSQSMKHTVNSPAKVSKQSIVAREFQSPLNIEKKRVSKQACHTPSRTPSTGSPSVIGEKKGVVKQSNHRVTCGTPSTLSPVENTGRCEIKGSIKKLSYSKNTDVTTPTRPIRPTTNRIPTNDYKSAPALKSAFNPSTLLSKSASRDLLSQLSGLYSELKNAWNSGSQKDSAKQSKNPVEHCQNEGNEENIKHISDINSNCLSECKYERSSHSGYDDPDKSSKSGSLEIINALQQRGNKNAGKNCSKSIDFKTINVEKNEDPVCTRDKMTSALLSTLHLHEDEEEESLGDEDIVLMEPHKKSSQSKIFNPSTWKKRRNDDGDKKGAHSSKKHNLKMDQADKKVQSSPPSPQIVSRLSSSFNQGKKSTTPMQPFRLRTSERSTAREFRKLQRSHTCDENMLTSSESRMNVSDMFLFLKRCAYMN